MKSYDIYIDMEQPSRRLTIRTHLEVEQSPNRREVQLIDRNTNDPLCVIEFAHGIDRIETPAKGHKI